MNRNFVVPRIYFAFRNGAPRIVIDGLPYDPRTIAPAKMREFIVHASRTSLMNFCTWNDRNGCFTDSQVRRELNREPLTIEEFREIVAGMTMTDEEQHDADGKPVDTRTP